VAGELSLGTLGQVSQSQIGAAESALSGQLQSIQGKKDVSHAEMLQLQYGMQKWTMTMQLHSTLVKEFGDALKGIVQKMA